MQLSFISLLVWTSCAATVDSFASPLSMLGRHPTTLAVTSDTTDAIREALDASKTFGATSPEARLAWEKVEDMDYGEEASEASKGSLLTECLLESDEAMSNACIEYGEKLEALNSILEEYKPKFDGLKSLAGELQNIKLAVTSSQPAPKSLEVTAALEAAKSAEQEFGPGSPEATVAWSELEEVASAGLSNAIGKGLTAEECEIADNAKAACEALEALSNALAKQKST